MNTKKIALITGVSREMGLGFEIARQMAALNFKVFITARDEEKVRLLAQQLQSAHPDVTARQLDILDDKSIAGLAGQMDNDTGVLDVLINNAASYFDAGAQPLETDIEFIKEAMDTNLLGAWRMVKHFIPLLRKSSAARIVNVSSGAASFADPVFGMNHHRQNVPVYSITKLALNGLTVKLARQLKAEGILVNAVDPGWIATYPGTAEWGARPVKDGAAGVVWTATLPDDGPTGGFFRDGETLAW